MALTRIWAVAAWLGIVLCLSPADAASTDGRWTLYLRRSAHCRPLIMTLNVSSGLIIGRVQWASGDAGAWPVTGTVAPDGRATITWAWFMGGSTGSGRLRGAKARFFIFHGACGTQTARGERDGPLKPLTL